MDKWAVYKKCDDFRVSAPRSVLDLVEIKSIAENGIFEVGKGNIFTKTYVFDDINYSKTSVDEQIIILENWCKWLNSNSIPFKITMNNKNKNMETVQNDVLFAKKNDEFNHIREYFNDEIKYAILNGRQGIEQELYLTLRYELSKEYEDARTYFNTIESNMSDSFKSIGSKIRPLNATERLRILHDFYRFGNEEYFNFDFKRAIEQGFDFKDAIINSKMDFSNEDYFISDRKYISAVYLKQLPDGKLSDRFLTKLSSLNIKMMCSIDIAPITDSDVDAMLKAQYMGIENRIRSQNKTRVKELDFNSEISLAVRMEKDQITDMIKDKNENNQHFFYTMMNILVISDSLEQLRKDVMLLIDTAKNAGSCIFDYSYMKQREALNTVLPIGVRQVANGRNLQTRSLASLFPFNVQELMMKGGNWYGVNVVSRNVIIGNRKKLLNSNGFIFGASGSGKTVFGSLEMMQAFLNTNDDVIVIDPKNDYKDICKQLKGAYLDISTTSPCRFNPLEFYDDGTKKYEMIADDKSELVLSLVERCKREELTGVEASLVNTALKYAYNEAYLKRTIEEKETPKNFYTNDNFHQDEKGFVYYLDPAGARVYYNNEYGAYGYYKNDGKFVICASQPNGWYDNKWNFLPYKDEYDKNGNRLGTINQSVTLKSLHEAFNHIDHPAAMDLQMALNLFVDGSLNLFGQQSNVDMSTNRLVMFGLKDMGTNLRDISMLVMLESIKERIMRNFALGKSTWLYIDEFHELMHTDYTQDYLKKLWVLVRSLGGICTGLTQNITDILINDTTKAMLENSEFLAVLRQRDSAVDKLRDDLGISDELIKDLITESTPGRGIIRCGAVTVPFDITIRHENALYDMVNTNFYEKNNLF